MGNVISGDYPAPTEVKPETDEAPAKTSKTK